MTDRAQEPAKQLTGERILLTARKIVLAKKPVASSGRHQRQKATGQRDAVAIVERMREATQNALDARKREAEKGRDQ